jgi:hypothetical protein
VWRFGDWLSVSVLKCVGVTELHWSARWELCLSQESNVKFEIWASYRVVSEESGLWDYDTVPLNGWFPTFRRHLKTASYPGTPGFSSLKSSVVTTCLADVIGMTKSRRVRGEVIVAHMGVMRKACRFFILRVLENRLPLRRSYKWDDNIKVNLKVLKY